MIFDQETEERVKQDPLKDLLHLLLSLFFVLCSLEFRYGIQLFVYIIFSQENARYLKIDPW
jgi:hypothetical protein